MNRCSRSARQARRPFPTPPRCGFGTLWGALDDLARSIRISDDLTGGETPGVLRLPPA